MDLNISGRSLPYSLTPCLLSWPSLLFYQCPLEPSGAFLEPSISLYLCQINLDLYETWNLSFWGPNLLIQFILSILSVLSLPILHYLGLSGAICRYLGLTNSTELFCGPSRMYRPLVLFSFEVIKNMYRNVQKFKKIYGNVTLCTEMSNSSSTKPYPIPPYPSLPYSRSPQPHPTHGLRTVLYLRESATSQPSSCKACSSVW